MAEPDQLGVDGELEEQPPVAHVRIVYTGPVAPHWDIQGVFGDETALDEFRQRAVARLQLLPPHDPQFRRNRDRVNRDAERENFIMEWDLGYDEEDTAAAVGEKPSAATAVVLPEDEALAPEAPAAEEPAAEEPPAAETPAAEEPPAEQA